ncbi:MAG: adenylate/guanylate cyclase domain-containing protein [Bacteroidia bacterium]
MKKALLIIFSFPFLLAAQPNLPSEVADSLWNVWQDETQPDTNRLKAIKYFTWDGYLYTKPDSAFYYAQLEFDFAKSKGLKKQMASALNVQGISFYFRGDFSKALEYYTLSLKIKEEIGDKKGVAYSLNNIGLIYLDQGDDAKAIDYCSRSLKINQEIGFKEGIAICLMSLGDIYFGQGNYANAMEFFTRCLKIDEETNNKIGIAGTLNNIGVIYQEQGDYDKAIEIHFRSLKIKRELNDKQGISYSLINIGTIYHNQGIYYKALEYHSRSLEIREELGDKQGIAEALINIGADYHKMKDYSKALEYYKRSLEIVEEIGDKSGMAAALNNIGRIYFEKQDYNRSLNYSTRSLIISQESGAIIETRRAASLLWKLNKKLGRHKKALEFYELYITMRDSIESEENQKEVIRQEFKYEYEKKSVRDSLAFEAEKAIQAEELEREKTVKNSLTAGFILVALFAGVFLFQRNRITKEMKKSEELLLNILPSEVAEELKIKGSAEAVNIDQVTVLFTDFKGFTSLSEQLTPKELVEDLNECFSAFDYICERYGIEKIKTIGDAYMAAGGLPSPDINHAQNVISAALDMAQIVENGKASKIEKGLPYFEIRIGIHTGPVVAGIVGVKKFQYDIWGDTVNTASRMESSGEIGKVNISDTTYNCVKGLGAFKFEYRGMIEAKGKGELKMYFASKA